MSNDLKNKIENLTKQDNVLFSRNEKIFGGNVNILLLATIILPLLIYSIFLSLPIPKEIGLVTRFNFVPVVILIILLLYPAYNLSKWIGTATAFTITLILFALPLSGLWQSGITDGTVIGGLLPWSDANAYYVDAQRLLEGGLFSPFSSRRPLFAGTLATILGLTQQNLQATLAILAVITAISCFLLAREVQDSYGAIAAVFILTILFFFYRGFIGTTLTEHLGLSLGTISFAIIWRGTQQKKINIILLGIFLLTLALNARAGAFFVLPALILWGSWAFRHQSLFSRHFLVGAVSAVLLGFLLNFILLRIVASPDQAPFSNFSYSLYGLVVGGKGWTQVLSDYPELAAINEPELSQRIYALSFQAFQANPLGLIIGVLKTWSDYFFNLKVAAFSFLYTGSSLFLFERLAIFNQCLSHSTNFLTIIQCLIGSIGLFDRLIAMAVSVLLLIFSFWGAIHCYRQRKTFENSLMIAAISGILLSVPFVPPIDAGMRPYAATIPVSAMLVTLGARQVVMFLAKRRNWGLTSHIPKITGLSNTPIIFGSTLAAFVFFGPIAIKSLSTIPEFIEEPCEPSLETIYVRVSTGSSVALEEDQLTNNRLINWEQKYGIDINKFREGLIYFPYPEMGAEFATISGSTTMRSSFDLKDHDRHIWLIAESHLMPKEASIVKICGQIAETSGFFYANSIQPVDSP